MLNSQKTKRKTLEKKVYQLIVSRIDGEKVISKKYQGKIFELVKKGIGGFIIFGGKREELKDFIQKIQSLSETPLLIASDIECGVGQQVRGATLFPRQMAMAAAINKDRPGDVRLLKRAVKAIADEAIDVGINMPLIPVLDVNQNPENPIICTRAFSDKPEAVAWFGSQYIKVLEGSGLISCGKHFPGHGETSLDSHISLPVISKSWEDLMNMDIMPFKEAIKHGVRSIMLGHLLAPSLDSKPASISKTIVRLLRERLGFRGLILTDALNMKALRNIKNTPFECLNAGADILLHPTDADRAAQELISAFEKHMITEKRIDSSVKRIRKIKEKLKNIKKVEVDYEKHKILSREVTDRSITLVKNKNVPIPLPGIDNVHMIFSGDREFYRSSPLRHYFKNISITGKTENIKGDTSIFAVFTSISAGKGSSDIGKGEGHRIAHLMRKAKKSIIISFGSPYVLRHFMEADMLIAAYEATEQAQKAVMQCLKGETDFRGRLPVTLNISE